MLEARLSLPGSSAPTIALAAGLRRSQPLGGLIALSTYLPGAEQAAGALAETAVRQPIFMAHGEGDPVIPLAYAERSVQVLKGLGFHRSLEPVLQNFFAPLGPRSGEITERIIGFVDNVSGSALAAGVFEGCSFSSAASAEPLAKRLSSSEIILRNKSLP